MTMHKSVVLPDGIIIPSSTNFLADVDLFLENRLSGYGVDPGVMTDIAISVSELVNNAIIHGNKLDISKRVDIRFRVTASEVRVTVSDEGNGFDYQAVKSPVADDNLLKEVGRGLFIVKNFVDEVFVGKNPHGGTCVEIVKKR